MAAYLIAEVDVKDAAAYEAYRAAAKIKLRQAAADARLVLVDGAK